MAAIKNNNEPSRSSRQTLGRRALKAALDKIEARLYRARQPFGVFIRNGAVLLIKSSTRVFAIECERAARMGPHGHLVGVYDARACLEAIRSDLEHFTK